MLSMTPRVRNGLCAAGPDGRQQAHGHAQPPRGWLPQPANRVPETSWQTPDQQFQPAFPTIFLILPRSSGQCRAGEVSRYMDTQKSGSFLHEPRRTSDAETVEKWDSRLVSVHKRGFFVEDILRKSPVRLSRPVPVAAISRLGDRIVAIATLACTARHVRAAAFGAPSASGGQVVATARRAQRARL